MEKLSDQETQEYLEYHLAVQQEFETIKMILDHSREEGLETEVVYFALSVLKGNPEMTITEAIRHGYLEWIK